MYGIYSTKAKYPNSHCLPKRKMCVLKCVHENRAEFHLAASFSEFWYCASLLIITAKTIYGGAVHFCKSWFVSCVSHSEHVAYCILHVSFLDGRWCDDCHQKSIFWHQERFQPCFWWQKKHHTTGSATLWCWLSLVSASFHLWLCLCLVILIESRIHTTVEMLKIELC